MKCPKSEPSGLGLGVRNIQSFAIRRASNTMRLRVSVDPKLLAIFFLFVAHNCEPYAEPSDIFANQ